MKKCIVIILLFTLLAGCAGRTSIPDVGDFLLDLPDGYAVTDIADLDCKIIRVDDDAVVGGIEYTSLKHKDVYGKKSDNIMLYLQETFHRTYDVEYIASHWGHQNKIVSVNLKKHMADGREEQFVHIFYERYQVIYHLWLDADLVEDAVIGQFRAVTGVD